MKAPLTVAALAASLLLAGCLDSTLPGGKAAPVVVTGGDCNKNPDVRVVVADIDSAMNPYHEYFNAGSAIYPNCTPSSVTPELLAELGVPPENVIELTRTGNIVKDKKADEAKWKKVRRGKPYWFKGTNIVGISFSDEPYLIPTTTPAKEPHGVGTVSSVLTANPDAVILMVETWSELANDDSHNYAFVHPAVDIITTSYGVGLPLVPVSTGAFLPETEAFLNSFEAVVKMGKLHFSSGGNAPGFTPGRAGAGPWWSIGVSGITEGEGEGKHVQSGDFPDFVSDFLQDIPYCVDCERGVEAGVGGTSFSTPRAAGVASRVLLEARRALGHEGGIFTAADGTPIMAAGGGKTITNWQIRRALEDASWVSTVADYDPVAAGTNTAAPPVDAAPWLTWGWGDLTALTEKGVVKEALAQLGIGGAPTRTKSADFCDFQTKIIEERINYWGTIALDGADHSVENMPFIFCGSTLPSISANPGANGPFAELFGGTAPQGEPQPE